MDQNETNFITDKEYIRGVIRKSVVSHDHIEDGRPSLDYLAPMTNVQVEFWQNFQANGGKILRCHTRQDRLDLLRRLAEDQQYNAVVCTHNNLCPDLEQAQMNYVNTLSTNTPMDAAVLTLNRFNMIQDIYGPGFVRHLLKAISDEIRRLLPQDHCLASRGEYGSFLL